MVMDTFWRHKDIFLQTFSRYPDMLHLFIVARNPCLLRDLADIFYLAYGRETSIFKEMWGHFPAMVVGTKLVIFLEGVWMFYQLSLW